MSEPTLTCFHDDRILHAGPRGDVTRAVRRAIADGLYGLLVFDDRSGAQIDLDLSGGADPRPAPQAVVAEPPRSRGRPRLGVIAREVTLLPRHWDWLATQPGGASVALRRLVEAARKADTGRGHAAREAAYRFMSAIAGNKTGFEEAARALFAGDKDRLEEIVAKWPPDIARYTLRLAGMGGETAP